MSKIFCNGYLSVLNRTLDGRRCEVETDVQMRVALRMPDGTMSYGTAYLKASGAPFMMAMEEIARNNGRLKFEIEVPDQLDDCDPGIC